MCSLIVVCCFYSVYGSSLSTTDSLCHWDLFDSLSFMVRYLLPRYTCCSNVKWRKAAP